MARKRKFSTVFADWKDVDELLDQLAKELKRYGVKMQRWDISTDDHVVTVSRKRVRKADVVAEFGFTLEDPVDVSPIYPRK